MNSSIIFLLIAIVLVGIFIFVAISLTGKRAHALDVEKYQTAFLKIENGLSRDNEASYASTIINADKLLDKALNELGVPGKTMGERLKKSANQFSQLNSVWYAHKMRNRIAHEHGFSVQYTQAKHALASYRQALKDLGAI